MFIYQVIRDHTYDDDDVMDSFEFQYDADQCLKFYQESFPHASDLYRIHPLEVKTEFIKPF